MISILPNHKNYFACLFVLAVTTGCQFTSEPVAPTQSELQNSPALSDVTESSTPPSHEQNNLSEFEQMLAGFPGCEIRQVYLDPISKLPAHIYFSNRKLNPVEVNNEFAYFALDEKFYGISAHKILIPASTYDVHALYMKESTSEVRRKLSPYFPLGFYSTDEKDLGEKPVLIEDPDNKDWSILSCSPQAD